MTEPRPADCTSPCIACMTDESHDPTPAPLSPPTADRAAVANAPTANRAAVLREAADLIDVTDFPEDFHVMDAFDNGAAWATTQLRRMADEAETGGAR
ncbi:hypothetical protein ACFW0U_07395 [Streptomyces albidoflavus]